MTTYIPSITLPEQIFAQPVTSIFLPMILGTAVGFVVSRTSRHTFDFVQYRLTDRSLAKSTQRTYLAIKQPPLRPPPQVFGPVWTILYGLMGYSAYRAWTSGMSSFNPTTRELTKVGTKDESGAQPTNKTSFHQQGATLYTIQLALNLIWMPLFFHFKRPVEATVDIALLTGVTGYLTYIWGQVDTVAGWALVPYLAWLGFASYLTVWTELPCAISC